MKKTTRKLISLLLLSVLLLSIALPAFAAPPEDELTPQAACSHSSTTTPTYTPIANTYVYAGTGGHQLKHEKVYKCKLCGMTFKSYVGYGTVFAHDEVLVNARCDGTTQTWFYNCRICGGFVKTVKYRCRGATHGGDCLWLPL